MSCDIPQNQEKLISANDCLEFLLENALPQLNAQTIPLIECYNRILASDICSAINVPNFDNTAMDGYAINLPQGLKPPYCFELVGRIAAGQTGEAIKPGQAVQIFTGAKLPSGANTVAITERSEEVGNSVEVFGVLERGENIRPIGDDISQGDVILQQGKKLTAADIGLLASVGITEVKVFNKLTVGVFFSGDEILDPSEELTDGKIYNSNQFTINALLTQLNFEVIDIGVIKDDFDITVQALEKLSQKCDVIITTGGVSIGEEDHIKPAVEKLGSIDMWAIKMKPGKPLAYGKVGNTHFAGLPGNPVSAMATFHLFIQPFLRKLSGENTYYNTTYQVQSGSDFASRFRREFMRVRLDTATTPPTAIAFKNQSSGVLSSMSWATGLLEVPDEQPIKKGDILNYYPL
jgi:molybdopterin molybdotransferase